MSDRMTEQLGATVGTVSVVTNTPEEEQHEPHFEIEKEWWELRLSPEVVKFFQGMGPNWQDRIDQALLMFVKAGGIWKNE